MRAISNPPIPHPQAPPIHLPTLRRTRRRTGRPHRRSPNAAPDHHRPKKPRTTNLRPHLPPRQTPLRGRRVQGRKRSPTRLAAEPPSPARRTSPNRAKPVLRESQRRVTRGARTTVAPRQPKQPRPRADPAPGSHRPVRRLPAAHTERPIPLVLLQPTTAEKQSPQPSLRG